MSWPLASFAIVAGVLLAGWLAYERSRPSARMVAVVATLAAVAALGRDAFVALPDVKPITAIALVVGYALGPLPGFTVGAIGMLASNMMLGQGPYTPWQMAAWGLVGLAGALLGRVSGRRMGRFGLALACAVMALVAKEIMNVYTWTLGAAHTPGGVPADRGRALPFDITDTVASFLFGFAFGPELARLLGRMRARMTVRWEPIRPPANPPTRQPTHPAAPRCRCCSCSCVRVLPWQRSPRAYGGHRLCEQRQPHDSRRFARARLRPLRLRVPSAYLQHAQNSDGGFGGCAGRSTAASFTRLGSRWAWRRPDAIR